MAAWQARVLTIFPGMFPGPLGQSLSGKSLERGDWTLEVLDIRDFAKDGHRSVDDAPFGGGAGMVMRPDVVGAAVAAVIDRPGPLLYMSPRGRILDQARVRQLAEGPGATLLCGRYEGVDQRVLDAYEIEEVSIGDYVLAGGELASMVLIETVVRLLPGVMGNVGSLGEESLQGDLLEYPHYTRPSVWEGRAVPEALLSGHHERIGAWRRKEAERLTKERRPDLWKRRSKREDEGRG